MRWSSRFIGLWVLGIALTHSRALDAEEPVGYDDLDQPAHRYHQRTLQDPFSLLKEDIRSGKQPLDASNELSFLKTLLDALHIPVTSQMLVFSTTSLQLSLISPSNPRALYFNEDVYLGYVPGGRIEIVSIDPELGGIYYLVDMPTGGRSLKIERSDRCMNCHASDETGHVPGLVIKSVIPGVSGGSLTAYRIGQVGHAVPIGERFGGWHLTGSPGLSNTWANCLGRMNAGTLVKLSLKPGERFDWAKFPIQTSDILPQLLHEHQAGFVNRAVESTYRARTLLHDTGGKVSEAIATELDRLAADLTRYLLFTDEARLPDRGIVVDGAFAQEFRKTARRSREGRSLKDLHLKGWLMEHRCSYMIYSQAFKGLPSELKQRTYDRLAAALSWEHPDAAFAYLPAAEKRRIHQILSETLNDLPRGWGGRK